MNNPVAKPRRGLAIASLVCGVFSVLCLLILAGIPAILCGHAARKRARREPATYGGTSLALVGLILGYVSVALTVLLMLAMLPVLGAAKLQSESMQCANNLRQIGMAVRLWAEVNQGTYPESTAQFGPHLGYARFLICPSDPGFKGQKIETKDFSRTSYTLTIEGASESAPDKVIARCPVHEHSLTAGGVVRIGHRPVPTAPGPPH